MKKITIMLLAVASLAISSCSKSDNTSTSGYAPVNTNVPYWGNHQELSATGGSDNMVLTVVSTPVIQGGSTVYTTVTSHLSYNDRDYIVNNIDSNNTSVNPALYTGHRISITGNGVTYSGTYTVSTFYAGNTQEAAYILTIDEAGLPTVFGNTMYSGQGSVPNF